MTRVSAHAAAPLILLAGGAAFESLRAPIAALLLGGLLTCLFVAARRPDARGDIVLIYAACLLVALNQAWGGVALATTAGTPDLCADRLAPFALARVAGAALVLAAVGVVLRLVHATPAEIGLRLPSPPWLIASLAVVPTVGAVALLVGPPLAEPFFGPLSSPAADLRGLAFALLFAVANATMEEVVYRGALLRWCMPVIGLAGAVIVQGLVFGLAHGVGADFVGSPLPVMAATAATGVAFGVLALRTRSLLLPIAIHVALDIPVFFGKVCLGL